MDVTLFSFTPQLLLIPSSSNVCSFRAKRDEHYLVWFLLDFNESRSVGYYSHLNTTSAKNNTILIAFETPVFQASVNYNWETEEVRVFGIYAYWSAQYSFAII